MAHKTLSNAKQAKRDEFYTSLEDIHREVGHYEDKFIGKVVYCNCDDPFQSNFVKYFIMNFHRLGLKELIAAGFPVFNDSKHPRQACALSIKSTKEYLPAGETDLDFCDVLSLLESNYSKITTPLSGNYSHAPGYGSVFYKAGDYRSDESIALLEKADIVVTNPPFSLFRDYVRLLVDYKKDFLILGNMNIVICKEIFPLLKEKKLWPGSVFNKTLTFAMDKEYSTENKNAFVKDGVKYGKVPTIAWYTNMDFDARHKMLPFDVNCVYKGHESDYPKYDNFDAIEVSRTAMIPRDYDGIMGVPITFLGKYCPEQFEIVWQASGNTKACAPKEVLDELRYKKHPEDRGGCGVINGKRVYSRIFIKNIKK